jgi:hypothetical protein
MTRIFNTNKKFAWLFWERIHPVIGLLTFIVAIFTGNLILMVITLLWDAAAIPGTIRRWKQRKGVA